MKKRDQYFSMSCYRYAPESFHAAYNHKAIPLYADEITTCGYAFICKGRDGAIAELKKIMRARERRNTNWCTWGFRIKDSKTEFTYSESCKSPVSNFKQQWEEYKFFKNYLLHHNCEVITGWKANLNANLLTEHENIIQVADLSRPIKVYFKEAA